MAGRVPPILVVEDDEAIRRAITLILEGEGYAVETAANGVEALEVTERFRPAVILLDLDMPILDGPGFAVEMHARYGDPAPVVVVTATRSAQDWAERIGANGYISKPFDLRDILAAVARFAGRG
jgi:two-component system chemotaxis response regulator CheY